MGLVGLMRTLRIEGEKAGIKVNALAPIAGTRLTGAPVDDDAPKGPGKVAPIAVALAHAQCPTNGEIYMAGAGWYSRVMIGVPEGWVSADATAETIIANVDKVYGAAHSLDPRSTGENRKAMRKNNKQEK